MDSRRRASGKPEVKRPTRFGKDLRESTMAVPDKTSGKTAPAMAAAQAAKAGPLKLRPPRGWRDRFGSGLPNAR
jgi:hypothetical protein